MVAVCQSDRLCRQVLLSQSVLGCAQPARALVEQGNLGTTLLFLTFYHLKFKSQCIYKSQNTLLLADVTQTQPCWFPVWPLSSQAELCSTELASRFTF